jgi:hypothetical protein
MRRPQISIAGLLLVVLVFAIGTAAIRSGSSAWAGAIFSITVYTMICSLLGVVLTRGLRRVYWSGFAVLGWSYLLLIYLPWFSENVGRFLLAPNLFESLEQILHPESATASLSTGVFRSMALGGFGGGGSPVAELSAFMRIGVALEALLWAYMGGWTARYFASGRESAESALERQPSLG